MGGEKTRCVTSHGGGGGENALRDEAMVGGGENALCDEPWWGEGEKTRCVTSPNNDCEGDYVLRGVV